MRFCPVFRNAKRNLDSQVRLRIIGMVRGFHVSREITKRRVQKEHPPMSVDVHFQNRHSWLQRSALATATTYRPRGESRENRNPVGMADALKTGPLGMRIAFANLESDLVLRLAGEFQGRLIETPNLPDGLSFGLRPAKGLENEQYRQRRQAVCASPIHRTAKPAFKPPSTK